MTSVVYRLRQIWSRQTSSSNTPVFKRLDTGADTQGMTLPSLDQETDVPTKSKFVFPGSNTIAVLLAGLACVLAFLAWNSLVVVADALPPGCGPPTYTTLPTLGILLVGAVFGVSAIAAAAGIYCIARGSNKFLGIAVVFVSIAASVAAYLLLVTKSTEQVINLIC